MLAIRYMVATNYYRIIQCNNNKIIMLAYLYYAAYIRMTLNEASPPSEQMCITFNDDGHDGLHVQAATIYTPITV